MLYEFHWSQKDRVMQTVAVLLRMDPQVFVWFLPVIFKQSWAVLSFPLVFSSQTAMEWGLLAGLLGFVSCWPGAVFSGWLLWVLDGEMGSMPVSEKLHAYPSPNPKLTLTCYQLTIGRGGGVCRYSVTPTQDMFVIHVYFKLKIISIGFCSFMLFFFINC